MVFHHVGQDMNTPSANVVVAPPKVTQAQKAAISAVRKAKRAVAKRLSFKSEKQQNEMLGYAADDMAHAYRIGAEEAQTEFLHRLDQLERALWNR